MTKDDIESLAAKGYELISIMNVAAKTIETEYLSILRLPVAFLQWIWLNRESNVMSEIKFELLDLEIKEEHTIVKMKLKTLEANLQQIENNHFFTNYSQLLDNDLDIVNIDEDSTLIEKLQKRTADGMQKCDHDSFPCLIELIKLYVCITFLRSTILMRVRCIAYAMPTSPILNRIINAIDKSEETVTQFFRCTFEQPVYNRAAFLGCFNPSEYGLICSYVKGKEVTLKILKESLDGQRYSIRWSIHPHHYAVMAIQPDIEMFWSLTPSDMERVYFEFECLSVVDNIFLIKPINRLSWCVYMDANGYLRGTNKKTGPEGEWKIIKFEDDTFMLCTRKWPGKFIYINCSYIDVRSEYGIHTDIAHWKLEKQVENK